MLLIRREVLLPFVLSLVLLLFTAGPASATPPAWQPGLLDDPHERGELIVQFAEKASAQTVDAVLGAEAIRSVERLKLDRGYLLRLRDATQIRAVGRSLGSDPSVDFVEPNIEFHLASCPSPPDAILQAFPTFDDPEVGCQWDLHNFGPEQTFESLSVTAVEDVDIDAPEAWRIESIGPLEDVPVAVIDSGVDEGHPDLVGNVDPIHEYDFHNDDGDAEDDAGHGTAVASVIAATAGNDEGIVGAAPGATIVNLRVSDDTGEGIDLDDVSNAIIYGDSLGVRVFNMSLSVGVSPLPQTLDETIDEASEDAVFVAAAGNSGRDLEDPWWLADTYPCVIDDPRVICVAAANAAGELWEDSNYGLSSVDIAAPGEDVPVAMIGDDYEASSGTSFATPLVSAAAALRIAHDPSATGAEVVERLEESSVYSSALGATVKFGGMLNMERVLADSELASAGSEVQFSTDPGVSNSIQASYSLTGFQISDDPSAVISDALDCEETSFGVADCAGSTYDALEIDAGDMADSVIATTLPNAVTDVTLIGGSGDDVLYDASGTADSSLSGDGGQDVIHTGLGTDTVSGGGDNDTIYAIDGDADTIDCGSGSDDAAWVDPGSTDTVSNCEDVLKPGQLDSGFDSDGKKLLSSSRGQDVAVQDDGKIVVAGWRQCCGSGSGALLARFNTDGSLDTTFNSSGSTPGLVGIDPSYLQNFRFDKVVIDPSTGDIIAGGANSSTGVVKLVRVDSDGDIDTGYDPSFGVSAGGIADLDIDPDDGAVVVSLNRQWSDHSSGPWFYYSRSWFARVLSNGSLDTGFDGDGIKQVDSTGDDCDNLSSTEIAENGEIWFAGDACTSRNYTTGGTSGRQTFIGRLETDGDQVSEINSASPELDVDGPEAPELALADEGSVVAAGTEGGWGSRDRLLTRYLSDGTVDTDFGTSGQVSFKVNSSWNDGVNDIIRLKNGGYAVVGPTRDSSDYRDYGISVHAADGTLDNRFSTDGRDLVGLGDDLDVPYGAVETRRRIVVAGTSGSQIGLLRYHGIP